MNTLKSINKNNRSLRVTENNNNVNSIKINDQVEFYFLNFITEDNKSFILDNIKKITTDYSKIKNINGEF